MENEEKPFVITGVMPMAKLYEDLSPELQAELNIAEENYQVNFFADINSIKFAHEIPGEPMKCVIVLDHGKYEIGVPYNCILQLKAKRAQMKYFDRDAEEKHSKK